MCVCMCVEGTRVEPLFCKYVTGTVAGVRGGVPRRRLVLELLLIPEHAVTFLLCSTCILHK